MLPDLCGLVTKKLRFAVLGSNQLNENDCIYNLGVLEHFAPLCTFVGKDNLGNRRN